LKERKEEKEKNVMQEPALAYAPRYFKRVKCEPYIIKIVYFRTHYFMMMLGL
jgi:hypothetical protein